MKESTKNVWKKIGWFCYTYTPMVAYFAVTTIVSGVVGMLMGVLGVLTGNGVEDIYGYIMDQIMLLNVFSQATAIIVFAFWYYFGCRRPSPKPPAEVFKPKPLLAICLTGIGIQFVVSMILNSIGELKPEWLKSYTDMMESAGVTEKSAVVFLSVVLLAPIVEELVFRGLTLYIAGRFTNRFWLANIMQALAFGIMHANLIQGAYAFLMGLVMGWVYYRFRSLYASIWLHFVINLAGLALMEPIYAVMPESWLTLIILLAAGLLLMAVGMKIIWVKQDEY